EANSTLANELDLYCRNDGQVAVIGRPVEGTGSPEHHHVIAVPNEDLACQLAGALAATHRGPFLIVAGPEGLATSDDRVRGFHHGLHAAGVPAAEVLHTGLDRAGGHATGAELAPRVAAAHREGAPVCLFAVSDVMAIGLVAGLREGGVQVPRDAAVAGFDDIETLRDFHPGLTTVRLPLLHIGRIAVESTVALPGGAAGAEPTVTGELMLRRSTTAAGQG
ncbi:MAG: substrate-binding domain-containing protein, partial [Micrococcaceae bacterium]|nr:substrate-binding domain-containing protein [Micrococcaceae bacterium]